MNLDIQPWDVVVTSARNRIGYSLLRSLAGAGLRVGLGVDSSSGIARHSRFCTEAFEHPAHENDPQGFIAAVRQAIVDYRPMVYLPAEEDVFVVADNIEAFRGLPVRIPVSSSAVLRQLDDKHQSVQLASSAGIPVPETLLPDSMAAVEAFVRQHGGRAILKLMRSSSSRGVARLESGSVEQTVAAMLHRSHRDFGEFVVQECVEGTGYGVSLLMDRGRVVARFAHRRLRERAPTGGPSTLRESVHHPALVGYAEALLGAVRFHGVAMVEFKVDESSDRAWFLEVNPRWWGSLALAVRAGVDIPALCYRMARGETLGEPPDYRDGIVVRWLLGDLLALKNQMMHTRRLPTLGEMFPNVDGYDLFHLDDPLPLAAEVALQVRRRLFADRKASRGSTPTEEPDGRPDPNAPGVA